MNQIFTHPGQPEMQVEVILASQGPSQKPIYTIRMRYPRPIHGEIMTHRVFSRNARSSRAVPVKTMLLETTTIPFVPWHWGKNQKGMQADEECDELIWGNSREDEWLLARDAAVFYAQGFMETGYHKQNPNRLLEPFSWIDTLITSTEWANFSWLREHEAAEPHLQDLARLVKQAIENAEINHLGEHGGWHLPYIEETDFEWAYNTIAKRDGVLVPDRQERAKLLCKISAARCARISYKPFDGDSSYERELARYDMLVTSDRVHASPTEHQATPDKTLKFFCSEEVISALGDNVIDVDRSQGVRVTAWAQPKLHGNLTGYIQARKLIPNEAYK